LRNAAEESADAKIWRDRELNWRGAPMSLTFMLVFTDDRAARLRRPTLMT